jgi:hypothetical protein
MTAGDRYDFDLADREQPVPLAVEIGDRELGPLERSPQVHDPLGVELAAYGAPSSNDPCCRSGRALSPERNLAELFGFSPAERRLVVGLLAGKTMREVATDSGVQITTVRTQFSSELIRILSNVPVVPGPLPEEK